jgi:hypothetical protein
MPTAEPRRDGSMYDLAEISEQEARAIMERTRAGYLPSSAGRATAVISAK